MLNFFSRLFRKSPQARNGSGPAIENWSVGEIAICVADGGTWLELGGGEPSHNPPAYGEHLRVAGLSRTGDTDTLIFEGRLSQGWDSNFFRKVRPDAAEGEMHDWELLLDDMTRRVDA